MELQWPQSAGCHGFKPAPVAKLEIEKSSSKKVLAGLLPGADLASMSAFVS
jgi:hypothetical protein